VAVPPGGGPRRARMSKTREHRAQGSHDRRAAIEPTDRHNAATAYRSKPPRIDVHDDEIIVSTLAFTVLGGALAPAPGSTQATNSANAHAMNVDRCPFIHLLSRCFGTHERDQSGSVVGNKKMERR